MELVGAVATVATGQVRLSSLTLKPRQVESLTYLESSLPTAESVSSDPTPGETSSKNDREAP